MSVGTITRILELQKGSNFEGKSMNEINGVLELQEGFNFEGTSMNEMLVSYF